MTAFGSDAMRQQALRPWISRVRATFQRRRLLAILTQEPPLSPPDRRQATISTHLNTAIDRSWPPSHRRMPAINRGISCCGLQGPGEKANGVSQSAAGLPTHLPSDTVLVAHEPLDSRQCSRYPSPPSTSTRTATSVARDRMEGPGLVDACGRTKDHAGSQGSSSHCLSASRAIRLSASIMQGTGSVSDGAVRFPTRAGGENMG
jgi:hypothetical protein